jgi:tetratricopeptide (TPR) repeat protein
MRDAPISVRISYDIDFDLLEVLKFGEAIDNQLPDEVDEPFEGFFVFRRGSNGPVIGFGVEDLYEFELPEPEQPLMPGFHFDAPTLGVRNGTAEQIVLAARAVLDGCSTPDVVFFDLAVAAGCDGDDEEAEVLWRHCLAAGDPRAHYGLGYTLAALGRPREAYGHFLEYTKVVPRNAWACAWLGQVSEAIGEREQAARHYRTAITLELEGSPETDARERLEALGHT